ncbi:protein kinase domain-containing protein [Ditylenchus destructor]|nr:protein kinase domain-containing protein [Ditylenchus destructor]
MIKRKIQDLTICLTYNLSCLHSQEHSMKTFRQEYRLCEEIGRGGFGIVYKGFRIRDNKPVAVKYVQHKHVRQWTLTEAYGQQLVPSEICHLEECQDIPGVVNLVDWFAGSKGFMIVMERPEHFMDLFDVISVYGRLDETVARTFFLQIVDTVLEMNQKHSLIHRDIKDENVIVDLDTGEIKLVDFGAADFLERAKKKEFQGTKSYCPPEWFKRKCYLPLESTAWSLGILLHILVTGNTPYKNEIQICMGRLKFPDYVSQDCQELIKLCLSQTPERRIKLEDVRSHIWTTKKFSLLHRTESSCSTLTSRYSSQKPFQKILKRRSIKRKQCRKRDSQAASGCVTDLSGSSDSEDSGDDTYSEVECSYRQTTPSRDKGSSEPKPITVPQRVLDEQARQLERLKEEARAKACTTYARMEHHDPSSHHPEITIQPRNFSASFSSNASSSNETYNTSYNHGLEELPSGFSSTRSGFETADNASGLDESWSSSLYSLGNEFAGMSASGSAGNKPRFADIALWESAMVGSDSSQYFSAVSAASSIIITGRKPSILNPLEEVDVIDVGYDERNERTPMGKFEEDDERTVRVETPMDPTEETGTPDIQIFTHSSPSLSSSDSEMVTIYEKTAARLSKLSPSKNLCDKVSSSPSGKCSQISTQSTPMDVVMRNENRRKQKKRCSRRSRSARLSGGGTAAMSQLLDSGSSTSSSEDAENVCERKWRSRARPISAPIAIRDSMSMKKTSVGSDCMDKNNNMGCIQSLSPNPTNRIRSGRRYRNVRNMRQQKQVRIQDGLPPMRSLSLGSTRAPCEFYMSNRRCDFGIDSEANGIGLLERLERQLREVA